MLRALNVIPESMTVMPASSGRSLALYVMYLTSSVIAESLWHMSAISTASPSLIATPHTHATPGPHSVQPQCFTCTCSTQTFSRITVSSREHCEHCKIQLTNDNHQRQFDTVIIMTVCIATRLARFKSCKSTFQTTPRSVHVLLHGLPE